jgi:hypothetical protein
VGSGSPSSSAPRRRADCSGSASRTSSWRSHWCSGGWRCSRPRV